MRLTVLEVLGSVNGVTTYRFSDGSVAQHQTVRDQRGFTAAGPSDTLNAAQLHAVSYHIARAGRPDGGWL